MQPTPEFITLFAKELVDEMSADDRAAILEAGDAEVWRDGLGQYAETTGWSRAAMDALLSAVYAIVSTHGSRRMTEKERAEYRAILDGRSKRF